MQINSIYNNFIPKYNFASSNIQDTKETSIHSFGKISDACKISISSEGREKLKEMSNSMNSVEKDADYREMLTKSIVDINGITQSNFHANFKKLNTEYRESMGRDCTGEELMANCAYVYSQYYDEIKNGYADGNREFWIVDNESEGGFRKITEDEEIAALDKAFEFYSQTIDAYEKYGRGTTEKIMQYQDKLYSDIESQQKRNAERMRAYEEKIKAETADKGAKKTENVYERMMLFRQKWKGQYLINNQTSSLFQTLVNQM